jgi:hypothetical protein
VPSSSRRATGAARTRGAVAAAALFVFVTRILGEVGLVRPHVLLAALVLGTARSSPGDATAPRASHANRRFAWPTSPVLLVALAGLALATIAVRWLPVWQWTRSATIAYVNFVLQHGRISDVPVDVPYVSTYPHAVELLFTAFRAMLPDDRLVEWAHVPLGLLGGLGVVALGALRWRSS